MLVTFINPQGRTNRADLSKEQVIRLCAMEKYQVIDFDLPEVVAVAPASPRIHTANESICVSCEG